MDRFVPLEAFEQCDYGVLVSGSTGRILFCNDAARSVLACSDCPVGRRCWEVASFRTLQDAAFCSPLCPVQAQARVDRNIPIHTVVLGSRGRHSPFDLLSFSIPPFKHHRTAVLHVLLPCLSAAATLAPGWKALNQLTPREREILGLLALGLSTKSVAKRLFISPVTVRNHVQSVLHKLGVHGRLEAVLAWNRHIRQPV